MGKIRFTDKNWTRDSVLWDAGTAYIFGDNLEGHGRAGQACIRGLSNAISLPTKWAPRWDEAAFFRDRDLVRFECGLSDALALVDVWDGPVVFHVETGRGLAQLHATAPVCYAKMLYEIMRRAV